MARPMLVPRPMLNCKARPMHIARLMLMRLMLRPILKECSMLKAMPMIMGRLIFMGKRMLIMRPVLIRRNSCGKSANPIFSSLVYSSFVHLSNVG